MSTTEAFARYLRELGEAVGRGDATEHTHRPALKTLLQTVGDGITATNEPRRIECGAPDFVVTKRQRTIGYVEAKDVGEDLDSIERDSRRAEPNTVNGKQLKRYRKSLSNLILTDYLDFRWFVDGVERDGAQLGYMSGGRRVSVDEAGISRVAGMLTSFNERRMPPTGRPKELAERMARVTRMISELIGSAFEREVEDGALHAWLRAFRETLVPDLSPGDFADMYAQTIAYGLFAARTQWTGGGEFARKDAAWMLPSTNPFLRALFNDLAGPDLDERISWLVDDLAQLLGEADMASVLEDFGKRTRREDPVVHFYETFLKEYDPKTREIRGVYYTPEPVVSYIVRSVDRLLRERFGRPMGLADESTLVLDPAAGTGTFLYAAIKLLYERLADKGRSGTWNDYVAKYLLPRLFGFELLVAPYAVAHLKLGLELQGLGYDFASNQRLGVYLTNTLEEAIKRSETLFAHFISDEANAAARIKAEEPIMVVMGNPPYSRHSANRGHWIGALLRDYYTVDGQPLDEKNPKWLQNDYVKFLRFGQWRIDRTGRGILAFITSHGYLDDPTFRGMRQSLMESFNDLYILDLHGNQNKHEQAPDGGEDRNVFDIRQGVAIGIFVRDGDTSEPGKVHHAEIWGERDGKYRWLEDAELQSTPWTTLSPDPPSRLFVPQDISLLPEWNHGHSVKDIFMRYASTVTTARNDFAIAFEPDSLAARISALQDKSKPTTKLEHCTN